LLEAQIDVTTIILLTSIVNKIKEFLKESNAIEGIYDDDSLQQSMFAWKNILKEDKLTTGVILKAHKTITLHHDLLPNEKGYFRECRVFIGGREGSPWLEVPDEVHTLVKRMNKDKTWKEIKQSHIDFEEIHPFVDGNGRTGRLIMNWQRVNIRLPIKVIKADKRFNYYKWFK